MTKFILHGGVASLPCENNDKYYFDQDHDKILKGLNILPVKIFTHYLSTGKYAATSGEDKLVKLEAHKEKLPVYAIQETEHVMKEMTSDPKNKDRQKQKL